MFESDGRRPAVAERCNDGEDADRIGGRPDRPLRHETNVREVDRCCRSVTQRDSEVSCTTVAVMRIKRLAAVVIIRAVIVRVVGLEWMSVILVLSVLVVVILVRRKVVVNLPAIVVVRESVENQMQRGNRERTDGEGERRRSRSVPRHGHPSFYDATPALGLPAQSYHRLVMTVTFRTALGFIARRELRAFRRGKAVR